MTKDLETVGRELGQEETQAWTREAMSVLDRGSQIARRLRDSQEWGARILALWDSFILDCSLARTMLALMYVAVEKFGGGMIEEEQEDEGCLRLSRILIQMEAEGYPLDKPQ